MERKSRENKTTKKREGLTNRRESSAKERTHGLSVNESGDGKGMLFRITIPWDAVGEARVRMKHGVEKLKFVRIKPDTGAGEKTEVVRDSTREGGPVDLENPERPLEM